jgi:hypothetical protein
MQGAIASKYSQTNGGWSWSFPNSVGAKDSPSILGGRAEAGTPASSAAVGKKSQKLIRWVDLPGVI